MPQVNANGLRIEIEEHGDRSHPAVLLIMGLATQLVHWPPAMIESLVGAGYRVITFDNRDIGLSERLDSRSSPSPALMLLGRAMRIGWMLAPYKLDDMARDTVGVLDALDIEQAHLLGVSMGGMIGQIVAAEHGDRLKSFTSIMSTTNNPALPKTRREVVRAIIKGRGRALSPEEQINQSMSIVEMISTPDGGRDEEEFRRLIAHAVERCNYPDGVRRQIAAIVASGDLRQWTRRIKTPTLIIHGKIDPLTPYQGSVDMASNIPGSKLEIIDQMGHDLPPKYLDQLMSTIIEHMRSAHPPASRVA